MVFFLLKLSFRGFFSVDIKNLRKVMYSPTRSPPPQKKKLATLIPTGFDNILPGVEPIFGNNLSTPFNNDVGAGRLWVLEWMVAHFSKHPNDRSVRKFR